MRSKRVIMGFAALLILFFHFYIPGTQGAFESFLCKSAYIGVDLFFLVSGMSLGKRKADGVWAFYGNRLRSTYLPFVVLALIAAVYKKWSVLRFFKVIGGVEFFNRGGGAFLWFLFGILIFYALVPFMARFKEKFPAWSGLALLASWIVLVTVLKLTLKNPATFILWNRFPVFLLGFYYDMLGELMGKITGGAEKWGSKRGMWISLAIYVIVLIAGGFLVAKTGTVPKLQKPIPDFYYVCAIPMVVAIAEILTILTNLKCYPLYPLHLLGAYTLETYGLQMIFGYDIENYLLKATGSSVFSFLITMILIIIMAVVFHMLRGVVARIPALLKKER